MLEKALQEAEDDERPGVADVDAAIDRRPARVDAHVAIAGGERFDAPGTGVMEANRPHRRHFQRMSDWFAVRFKGYLSPRDGWVAPPRGAIERCQAGLCLTARAISRRRARPRRDLSGAPRRHRQD